MKKIKIIVATHKKYEMPNDDMYIPIQVGSEGKEKLGYVCDNSGDNISIKNSSYCELTGLYWAWKNLDADYVGLVHYRRYFAIKRFGKKFDRVLSLKDADKLLDSCDVILPKKRRYFIETLYSHYNHTMYVEPLDKTRKIISSKYPDYLNYFDELYKRRSAHMFNMFIMKKDILNDYCEWLFDILETLENSIDSTQYDSFHSRFYGRISELLLDVYIRKNNIKYKEVKFIYMEKINYLKKISSFLKAKFKGEKYGKSF